MSDILYPLILENEVMPVVYKETSSGGIGNGKYTFYFKFKMNLSNSKEEISRLEYQILTITEQPLFIQQCKNTRVSIDNNVITFIYDSDRMDNAGLTLGQFYKVRLRYYSSGKEKPSPWSNIGVVKLIQKPIIKINNWKAGTLQTEQDRYTVSLTYPEDELLGRDNPLKYRFRLEQTYLNEEKTIILEDTGEQLIPKSLNNIDYVPSISLPEQIENVAYYIYAEVTLESNYSIGVRYRLLNGLSVNFHEGATDTITKKIVLDVEPNGWSNKITIKNGNEGPITGTFFIAKKSSLTNFNKSEILYKFTITNKIFESAIVEDYFVNFGEKCEYYIYRENSAGFQTEWYPTNPEKEQRITCKNEELILADKDRVLVIKFDPQMTTLKEVLQESKEDTMGGKYPIFFRNGKLRYKEFNIGGKISYLMDENFSFMKPDEWGVYRPIEQLTNESDDFINKDSTAQGSAFIRTTNLTAENFDKERIFKNKVLEWLNNGQPKLLRAPAEGTYLVRLMNVSMSAEKGLGRMIHSFTATAYEMAEYNQKNLKEILKIEQQDITARLSLGSSEHFKTTPITGNGVTITGADFDEIQITDAAPGSLVTLDFIYDKEKPTSTTFKIGKTGNLFFPKHLGIPAVNKISFQNNSSFLPTGNITYHIRDYYGEKDEFERLKAFYNDYWCESIIFKDINTISNDYIIEAEEGKKFLLLKKYFENKSILSNAVEEEEKLENASQEDFEDNYYLTKYAKRLFKVKISPNIFYDEMADGETGIIAMFSSKSGKMRGTLIDLFKSGEMEFDGRYLDDVEGEIFDLVNPTDFDSDYDIGVLLNEDGTFPNIKADAFYSISATIYERTNNQIIENYF